MFSEKEIKNLKLMSSKRFRLLSYFVVIFVGITSFGTGISNLICSNNIAHMIDLNAFDVFVSFLRGFDISKIIQVFFALLFKSY